jgi:hypothetical protein
VVLGGGRTYLLVGPEACEFAVIPHHGDGSSVARARHDLVLQAAHLRPQHLVQLPLAVEELAQLTPVGRGAGGRHRAWPHLSRNFFCVGAPARMI